MVGDGIGRGKEENEENSAKPGAFRGRKTRRSASGRMLRRFIIFAFIRFWFQFRSCYWDIEILSTHFVTMLRHIICVTNIVVPS